MVQTSERFQAIFSKLHYDVITAVITALQHLPKQLFLSVLPRQYFRGHCLNNILIASYVNGWGRNFVTKIILRVNTCEILSWVFHLMDIYNSLEMQFSKFSISSERL